MLPLSVAGPEWQIHPSHQTRQLAIKHTPSNWGFTQRLHLHPASCVQVAVAAQSQQRSITKTWKTAV